MIWIFFNFNIHEIKLGIADKRVSCTISANMTILPINTIFILCLVI